MKRRPAGRSAAAPRHLAAVLPPLLLVWVLAGCGTADGVDHLAEGMRTRLVVR